MQAEYKENLLFGGKLVVTAAHIEIVCYFRGPDLRYRGEWIHIPYSNFDEYISAFRQNFKKYEELKTQMKDCEFSCVGVPLSATSLSGTVFPPGQTRKHITDPCLQCRSASWQTAWQVPRKHSKCRGQDA